MKKVLMILAACAAMSFSASAQGGLSSILGAVAGAADNSGKTGNILNSISKVIYSYTGNLTAVDLPADGPITELPSESAVLPMPSQA